MMKIDETAVACCGGKIGSIVKIKNPSTELKCCVGHEAIYFGGAPQIKGAWHCQKRFDYNEVVLKIDQILSS